MRRFSFLLSITVGILLLTGSAIAQTGDWAAVEGLSTGTAIQVKTKQGKKIKGEIGRADTTHISMLSIERHFPGRIMVQRDIPREDVKEVRLVHPYVSSAAGAAIGAGVGVGVGLAIDSQYSNHEDRGVVSVVFGLLGAGVGSAVGKTTAFIKSKPIYIAP